MSLVEFLLARIAEDEADALSAMNEAAIAGSDWSQTHLRVLAECEAKRRIVENCRADYEDHLTSGDDTGDLATETLMMLAALYADHPDYREDWAL